MKSDHRLAPAFFLGAAACFGPALSASEPSPAASRDEIVHVLNRTSFGIRPGDVERVQAMGLQAYLDRQLHPETIDDSAVDLEVARLPMLQLSQLQLCQLDHAYTINADKRRKEAAQREALAASGGKATVANTALAAAMPMSGASMMASSGDSMTSAAPSSFPGTQAAPAAASISPTPAPAMNASPTAPLVPDNTLSTPVAPGIIIRDYVLDQVPLPTDPAARRAEVLRRGSLYTPNLPADQLRQAKLVRAVNSERQLQEVLVDFWSNHFNISVGKDDVRTYAVNYDLGVIRPHIWGSFHDLLEATAKSPAMLLYLDNASNMVISPDYIAKHPQQAKRMGGLNENYGREIMELHALGVNAGYKQKDVQEVARCFTGWTFNKTSGEFVFHPELHDNGSKVVLGHVIAPNGGMQDGETVLDILASSPQCAHFISRELCQRFVSDHPTAALVDRIAGVFTATKGDLRAVTEAILTSPEFLDPASFNNKIKSPSEFAVSAIRASGATLIPDLQAALLPATLAAVGPKPLPQKGVTAPRRLPLRTDISTMGEPLYSCTPPTGYPEVSSVWVSPGTLIDRLNFAIALTEQNVNDTIFDTKKIMAGIDLDKPTAALYHCVAVLLQNKISDATRKVLMDSAVPETGSGKTLNPNKLIALILGSPEFQRK